MEKPSFRSGFRAMLPITTGVIPFGAVTGTICHELGLKFYEAITMNTALYAGASQLAAMDLMKKHAAVLVVILTGLAINLRFLLYSAAMAQALAKAKPWQKFICAHTLTDQSYAVMMANQDKLDTTEKEVWFYLGTAACMLLVWQSSFIAGFVFGNFAPSAWALDFAVPLSFLALVIPTIKNRVYLYIAAYSAVASVFFYHLPFRSGLIVTALTAIALGAFLTRRKAEA
jgi:4-azaleucine resistance transporter AzlC